MADDNEIDPEEVDEFAVLSNSPSLPDWVTEADGQFLKNLSQDPQGTLSSIVKSIIGIWIVGGILDIWRGFLDAAIAVVDAIVLIPQTLQGLLLDAGGALGAPVLTFVGEFQTTVHAAAQSFGPAAIYVEAGFYALLMVVSLRALPAVALAASDALSAIPVVGSLLNAIVTAAVNFVSD